MSSESKHIVIIGAGAAGCFAAINAARRFPNCRYTLLEATHRPLTKVLISGGGRCNVTHHCYEPELLVKNYPRGQKELIGTMTSFGPKELCQWFEEEGVSLKSEADGRIFPATNSSKTIASCLLRALEEEGVKLHKGKKVISIKKVTGGFNVQLQGAESIDAYKLMIATGSSPTGYNLAAQLGHTIVDLVPSLFTFKVSDPFIEGLMGQSVSHAKVSLSFPSEVEKKSWSRQGPLLITHWGFSGPAILKLSAFAARPLHRSGYQARLTINWLGEMTEEQCFQALWENHQKNGRKECGSTPLFDLSKRLWRAFLGDIATNPWHEISKKYLRQLAKKLCHQNFQVSGKGIFKEEFVTCGGVKRSEVNFKTMESKLLPSLYFSGEVLDIDGITGGFNFQNAWTGSWIASRHLGDST